MEFKDIKELVVDCKRWVRGKVGGDSKLLNEHDNMCCLGFECLARGFSSDNILNVGSPGSACSRINKPVLSMTTSYCSNLDSITKAIEINDDKDIKDSTRMKKLRKLFSERGIKLKFINTKSKAKKKKNVEW